MTTLPQTTSARLPQGVGAGAAMLHATASSAPPGAAFQMTAGDIWRIIRANMWLIIILVLVCGTGAYFLHRLWAARWPSYTATGLLQIRTEIMKDPVADRVDAVSDTRLATLLRTQQQMLQAPQLFSLVLSSQFSPVREKTEWFKQFGGDTQAAKEDLEDNFRVSIVPDSALLAVRMTCRNPADTRLIIEEVVRKHLEKQAQDADSALTRRTQALRLLADAYQRQLDDLAGQIRRGQETLANSGYGVEGMFSAKEIEMRALVENALKLSGEAQEAQGIFERAKAQIDAGKNPPEIQKFIDMDPLVMSLSRTLTDYQISHAAMISAGPDHRDMQRIAALAEITSQKLADRQNELAVNLRAQYLAGVKAEADQKAAALKAVRDQIEQLKKEHQAVSQEVQRLAMNREKEKSLTQEKQQTTNILSMITASYDKESQVRIGWAIPPETPEIPSWPKLWFMLPAGVMFGLLLALGIAFLREFLDDTVRSPRDVTRVGQMALLGIIADEDDDPAVANAKLPIFDAPHSVTAEQFRQVRTRLQHATALETTRSIMVTGPSPLDGKTTVAANLAAGLALNGRKILLVDANFRRPELHRLFGFANDKGFSDVLNGTAGLDDCLHASRIPNLSVLTSGPKPPNATELFESQLLVDFIERALEEFDHVIFDTGPFLVVSESVAMAPRVDGVVSVVRAHEESRGTLQRMRDSLRQIKAEHIGVVLNAVRAQGGGYYRRNIKTYYTYNNGQ